VRLVAASVLYFAIVFGAGFMFGPIRIFWLEPRLGKAASVLCEAPFLLAVMILAAQWVPTRTGLTAERGSLAAVGICALFLQQLADFAVGTALRGLTFSEQVHGFATPQGLVYIVLLLLFAAMPLLVNSRPIRGAA
jgi:hypothetical protein